MKQDTKEMLEFLRNHIPLVLDLEKKDIVCDTKSMYYKIFRYIIDKEK